MPERAQVIAHNAIVIIGRSDAVMGFAALGFTPYPATNSEEAGAAIDAAVSAGAAVCLVQAQWYDALAERIIPYAAVATPVFIPFLQDPAADVLSGMLKEIRLRATGAHL